MLIVFDQGNADEPPSLRGALLDARRTMGIYQHHDAVTGTAKKHVNDDYGHMLHSARHTMREAMRDALEKVCFLLIITNNLAHSSCVQLLRSKDDVSALSVKSDAPALLTHDESESRDSNSLPMHVPLSLDRCVGCCVE